MELSVRRYTLFDIIRIPFSCSAGWSLLYLAGALLSGLAPIAQVYFTGVFIDTALSVLAGNVAFSSIYRPIAIVVLTTSYDWMGYRLIALVRLQLVIRVRDGFRTALTEKRARLAFSHIENSGDWDLIRRVCETPEEKTIRQYEELMELAAIIIHTLGVLAILLAFAWWTALLTVAVTVPMVIVAMKSGKANYQAERDSSRAKRVYEYLSDMLLSREATQERAMFSFTDDINQKYESAYESARKIELKSSVTWFARQNLSSILLAVTTVAVIGILIQPVISGALSIGLFMSLTTAVLRLIGELAWGMVGGIDNMAKAREAMVDLTVFTQLNESKNAVLPSAWPPPSFESLELRGVRFRYPGTEAWVLDGLSLRIESGRHYAFVGINGAGKTTIMKLITGLYDEYEGEILLNGRNLREYDQQALKAFYSVVYQDFARYQVSVRDNITFGDSHRADRATQALATSGLNEAVDALPMGMDTPLGKLDAKGVDLSGGQWQRLAMARALASAAPLRILDEPTAALDPISESRMYREFERISLGVTTLFISHRLGSTSLADIIFVLADGRVTEQGTHRELMDRNGVYTRMYEAQRSWYQ